MRSRTSLLLAIFCGTTPAVSATPVLSNMTTALWKRTTAGEVIYVAADDVHLTALCVQIGAASSWIPAEQLANITLPILEKVDLVHGMGLSRVHDFIPDWGPWGLSVEVQSFVESGDNIKDGPTYFFVLSNQQVVYRVVRQWLPVPGKPGMLEADEQWAPINPRMIGHAPCTPPA